MLNSPMCISPSTDLDTLVHQYELTLRARPHAPWFNNNVRLARRELRRHERRWKSSKLEVHRQIFKEQCSQPNDICRKS